MRQLFAGKKLQAFKHAGIWIDFHVKIRGWGINLNISIVSEGYVF
jgi:hypothetical protein